MIEFIPKSIKHCYLRVRPNGIITLTHNKYLKKNDALTLLNNNWDSILKKHSTLTPVKDRTLCSGSYLYFLGEEYRLEVITALVKKIELSTAGICLYTPDDGFITKDKIIRQWYKSQSQIILQQHYSAYLPKIYHWNVETPALRFRTMKRRWGSYNKKLHTVTLNTELIKVKPDFINYIIAHELCHILHFNHGRDFYACLTSLHPTWREEKQELNQLTSQYLE